MRGRRVLLVLALAAPPAGAQVDPSGPWRTWHTEHFRVHARSELAEAAVTAGREAERAYALLAGELVPPRGMIDLVVADNVDFSNGFAAIFPSNVVTVYLAPPEGGSPLRYFDAWLRLVVVHELTHVFHMDRSRGVWRVAQRVFGRAPGLFPNIYQPSWVMEGLATYYESRFTLGGRLRGADHRRFLAAAADGGAWVSDPDATLATSKWPGGVRPYAWGGEFFRLQAADAGDGVVSRFIERASGQWWPLNTSRPLQQAGGLGVTVAWDMLRWEADSAAFGRSGVVEVLDRGLRQEPGLRASPDGRLLAYVRSDGRSEPAVVVREFAGMAEIARHRVNGPPGLAWVGDTLYVAQLDFASPVEVRSDLYRWVPGGAWERVTSGARLAGPFATPTGSVAALDEGAGRRRAVTYAGGVASEFHLPEADVWGRIDASPDGARLAGARNHNGRWDIVVWPSGAPDRVLPVTDDAAFDEEPVWRLDGRSLLFVSERDGFPQIFAFDVTSGRVTRLTDEPVGAGGPAPGPDTTVWGSVLYHDGYAVVRFEDTVGRPTAAAPAPAPAFEPAPVVSAVHSGYAPWAALRPHYWVPLAYAEGRSGSFLGGFTSGTDPVGRVGYGVWAGISPDPLRWEGGVAATYTRWRDVGLDIAAGQTWDGYLAHTASGLVINAGERERWAELGIGAQWRRWRSAVAARGGVEWDHVALFDEDAGGVPHANGPAFVGVVGSLKLAHWSRPALAISPENGGSVGLATRRRWALYDDRWSWDTRVTATGYLALPLPGFAHWVLAGRGALGWSGGSWPAFFSVGGESSEGLVAAPGLGLGGGQRTFPLRGYPQAGGFTRAWSAVGELRVPLLLVGRGARVVPLFLDRVSVFLFGEGAGGWNAGMGSSLSFADVGSEMVLDLGVMRDLPTRARIGAAVALQDGAGATAGAVRQYVAIGTSF